jgi:DNA repair protein RadC
MQKFILSYRIQLVKDRRIAFEPGEEVSDPKQCQPIARRIIETLGQTDREQICVIMLNVKNEIIGTNMVHTGYLNGSSIHPREVFKPALLLNAGAIIMCHNHPSGGVEPSPEDLEVTTLIMKAAHVMQIPLHDHMIISTFDDSYYSFLDAGIIPKLLEEIIDENL